MLVRQNLDQQVYEILQSSILNGKYKAGFKIVPNDISSELGISKTPITHALKRLEQDATTKQIWRQWICLG